MKIMFIFGTRPEAIKLAPVINELKKHEDDFHIKVCVTAQHRQMLDQVMADFEITSDYDLNIMEPGQDLFGVTCEVLKGLKHVLNKDRPNMIIVHGDTTTSMVASLAAYYLKISIGHVEAGLRTYSKYSPFPEEINRKITGILSDIHFAPTEIAKNNLLKEGVQEGNIFVCGNTVVDALLLMDLKINSNAGLLEKLASKFDFLDPAKRMILVTGHRRENFGSGFENICNALVKIAEHYPDVEILYPVHLNPNVQEPVKRILGESKRNNIHLIPPVDYLSFVYLMKKSYFIITDSGGLQEEAPSLGKPVLVMRDTTERPESIEAGTARLVGTDENVIYSASVDLLDREISYREMSCAKNPYGDGYTSKRIAIVLREFKNKF